MTATRTFSLKRITENYWFYPIVFSLAATAIAVTAVTIDRRNAAQTSIQSDSFEGTNSAEAAEMLSVIAGSIIGVTATVFIITIAAVAYASGKYGPRLLNNFLENRGNQLSLAVFLGSFFYAIIVLRSARTGDGSAGSAILATPAFTPQVCLVIAYVLLGVCVAVLIYFLNHIPSSIRIGSVLESIGKRLIDSIKATYPIEYAQGRAPEAEGGADVVAWDTGYIQQIDFTALEHLARSSSSIFSLTVRTGDFVHRDLPLLKIKGAASESVANEVRQCFVLGSDRMTEQDPQFLIDELVEIGLRAMSSHINDPNTAITSLHWLGAATAEIGRRDLRKDACGVETQDCPVIPRADDFSHFVERGFGSMRDAAANNAKTAKVMLEAIENAALTARHPPRRAVLRKEAEALLVQSRDVLTGPELTAFETRYSEFAERVPASQIRVA